MSSVLDINAMVTSIYDTIISLQQSVTETMGIDVYWCRALPYQNGEDIIVLEYTLTNVECPKQIKVVTDNTGYQAGNFQVDLWGVTFDAPLEVSIDISTWETTYGKDTMPQKGDIVVMPMLHRIFQVTSSTIVNSLATLPTSYKVLLGKYSRQASRKESDDIKVSIDELTRSQEELFGDDISKEVADGIVEVETSYNETTYVDPIKTFDIDCIDIENLYGGSRQLFAESYYNFNKANKDVIYSIDAEYDKAATANNLIYTCWFKLGTKDETNYSLKITGIHHKDKSNWYFNIQTNARLASGDDVVISRGSLLSIMGTIDDKMCEDGTILVVTAEDVFTAQRKLASWWNKPGAWKLKKPKVFNLFSAYNGDNCVIDYSIQENYLKIKFGDNKVNAEIKNMYGNWNYIAIEVNPSFTRYIVSQERNMLSGEINTVLLADTTDNANNDNIEFDTCSIENKQKDICMCNIRLYENEYELEDTWLIDRYSEVTRNASKLILVDVPRPSNKMTYISTIK